MSYQSISTKPVKVRKPHRCEWCAGGINKGEPAQARAYVFDGEFVSGHMHPDCYEAMNNSSREVVSEGWMAGDFERGQVVA
jgi:hypothetical protein